LQKSSLPDELEDNVILRTTILLESSEVLLVRLVGADGRRWARR